MSNNIIINKNGVRYLVCEPAFFLKDRYPIFNSVTRDGRVFAVNLETNKLVTIVADESKGNPLGYYLRGRYIDGRPFEKRLSKEWEVANVQMDDYINEDELKDVNLTILDSKKNTVFTTHLSRCVNLNEFYRQSRYAYGNIR